MLSLKSHAFLCEKSLNQINGLYVATDPTTIIQSNNLELVPLPARSYTQDCAPTACSIEKGHLLGHMERLVQRQDQHARAERHAVGLGGQSPQRLERPEPRASTVRQRISHRHTL